jgi:hypothetical protein
MSLIAATDEAGRIELLFAPMRTFIGLTGYLGELYIA